MKLKLLFSKDTFKCIKSDTEYIYNITKDVHFKCCSLNFLLGVWRHT